LFSSTSALAQAATNAAPPAASSDNSVGEIVVTARRRAENLVDVPITINALSSATIQERGVSTVAKVAQLTPGLQFDRGAGPADIRPSLRGIALIEGRSNVAIIVDGVDVTGVTLNTNIGGGGAQTAAALMDLDRVEVVKGPQTVYFGRSAFAGAIQFVSREPSFTPGARFEGALGDFGRREITGTVTGPIVKDLLAGKLTATYRNFDGFYTNPGNGQHLDGDKVYGVGGAALLDRPGLKAKLNLNYIHENAGPGAGYVVQRPDVSQFGVNRIDEDFYFGNLVGISSNIKYKGNDSDTWRGVLNISADLTDELSLQAISGLNVVDSQVQFDFDTKTPNTPSGTALPGGLLNCLPGVCVGIFDFDTHLRQLSQEVRLSYKRDNLRALLGGYLFSEKYDEKDYTRFVGSQAFVTGTRAGITPRPSSLKTTTYSAFGSLEMDVTPALTLTGELRFNHETIEAAAATGFNILFQNGSTATTFRGKKSFNSLLPRVSARYKLADDVNLYASAAKGTKPGGFNVGQIRDDLRPFDQEKIWTYELGAKGRFFDRRLSIDAALFYSDWRNVQVTTICYGTASPFGPEAACPTATAVSLNYIINADKAEVKGAELSLAATPMDGLTVKLDYVYTDSKFKDFLARDVFPAPASPTPRQFGGNRMPLIPKHSLSASVRYERDVGAGLRGFVEVDPRYRSSRYARFDNRVLIAGKTTVDAQVGVKRDGWTAMLFADNVFNNKTPEFTRYYGNFNPSIPNGEYIVAPPLRDVGVRVTAEF
jgi:outer membrane receptor protein involved in Fe transport